MQPAAALSLLIYAAGLPLGFLFILVKHRVSIRADQALRAVGQGTAEATNPYFHIRTRYQELYRFEFRWCLCTLQCQLLLGGNTGGMKGPYLLAVVVLHVISKMGYWLAFSGRSYSGGGWC